MKGTLHNQDNIWVVRYMMTELTQPPHKKGVFGVTRRTSVLHKGLPLHPGPWPLPEGILIDDILVEGKEVEFEIKEVYVEPDESIHCNRGADVKYAKLIFPEKTWTWNDIINEYYNDKVQTYTFADWLKKHYNPPTKK